MLVGAPASAASPDPFPGSTRSHYLTGTGVSALAHAGARDARDAAAAGITDGLVILGGGEPADATGGHVLLPGSGHRASYDEVRQAAVAYGRAWHRVPQAPPLTLVVMAAAHGPHVGTAAGAGWGRLVARVARALPGVDVRGGLDVEVEWSPAVSVRSWLTGYLASTDRGFVDVGSCTCPPLARLPAGWTRGDLAAVASASGRGVVVPQIYATAGGNATEWAALAAWAASHGRPAVRLAGVLTEQAACTGPPARACAGIDLGPLRAWQQLAARSGQPLRWATDIGYLSAPGRVHAGRWAPALLALGALALAGVITTLALLGWRGYRPARPAGPRRRRRRRVRRHRRRRR